MNRRIDSSGGGRADCRAGVRQPVWGISGTYQFRLEVRILDVSGPGLGIETAVRLPFLDTAHLRVEVSGLALQWHGRIVWCRIARLEQAIDGSRPIFHAGFQVDGEPSVEELVVGAQARISPLGSAFSPGPQTR